MSKIVTTAVINHLAARLSKPTNPFESVLAGAEQEILQLLMVTTAVQANQKDKESLLTLANLYEECQKSPLIGKFIKSVYNNIHTEISFLRLILDSLDTGIGMNQYIIRVATLNEKERHERSISEEYLKCLRIELPKLMDRVGFNFEPIQQRYHYSHEYILIAYLNREKLVSHLDSFNYLNEESVKNNCIRKFNEKVESNYEDIWNDSKHLESAMNNSGELKRILNLIAKKSPYHLKILEEELNLEYAKQTINKINNIKSEFKIGWHKPYTRINVQSKTVSETWNDPCFQKKEGNQKKDQEDIIKISIQKSVLKNELELQNQSEIIHEILKSIDKQLYGEQDEGFITYSDFDSTKIAVLEQYQYWFDMANCKLSSCISNIKIKRGLQLYYLLKEKEKKITVLEAAEKISSMNSDLGKPLTIKQSYESLKSVIDSKKLLQLIESQIDYRIKAPYPFKPLTLEPLTYGIEFNLD